MDAEPHLRLKLTSIDALLYNIFMTLKCLLLCRLLHCSVIYTQNG